MVRVKVPSIIPIWSERLKLAVVSLICLAGVVLVLYTTAIAPWAYSDSAVYTNTALNIASGKGIVMQDSNNVYTLLPFHAPLYPLVLSLPIALGSEALEASRWLNAILYGLTIFLAYWATYRFTRSFWLAASAAGLCLFSLEPLRAYTGAMAEGLFLFFSFLSLILVALAIRQTDRSTIPLFLAGTTAGLAILSRYTGLSVMAAGALSVLLLFRGNFKTKVRKMSVYAAPAIFLAALWFIPVYFSTNTFGSRPIGKIGDVIDKFESYFSTFFDVIGGWIPFFYRGNHIITPIQKLILGLLILFILVIVAAIKIRKKGQFFDDIGLLTWGVVLLLFSAAYIGLHLASYILAADRPDVNGRLLLPLFYTGILLAAALIAFIGRSSAKPWLGSLVFTALALLTIWYFHNSVKLYVYEMHHYGQGYTSNRWNENSIFDRINELDDSYTLYSNEPSLVLFYNSRIPKSLAVDSARSTYQWPQTGDDAVILFIGAARKDIGEGYPSLVESLKSDYQTIYEDNEGLIFIPRQP